MSRERPNGPPQCFNCGADTNDWDYIGDRAMWVCGARDCYREILDANREITEHAQLDAMKDDYGRYR